MSFPIESAGTRFPWDRFTGWTGALGVWLLGCLLAGYGCFCWVGRQLRDWPNQFWAAVVWQLTFFVAMGIILTFILAVVRGRGGQLRELGWRKPVSWKGIVIGIALGLLYTSGVYAGIVNAPQLKGVNPWELHWVRFALVPVGVFMAIGEEAMMRGFFMNELARVRVPVWLEVLLSGTCSAVYHSMHDISLIGFLPSFFLFTIHAWVFVANGRSLTPTTIAHSLYHVLGAPYLLMFALAGYPGGPAT